MRRSHESRTSRPRSVFLPALQLIVAAILLLSLWDSMTSRVLWGWERVVVHVGLAVSAAGFVALASIGVRQVGGALPGRWIAARAAIRPVLSVVLAITVALYVVTPRTQHPPQPSTPPSIEHARWLAIIFSERAYHQRPWPPYGGRNFVLSLVAHKLIDVRNPQNLEIFFCPGSPDAQPMPPRAAYEEVTKESLAAQRFPNLTDFAGRRNDEPAYRLQPGDHEREVPILGCRMVDGAIVGFSNGRVRWLDRENLGLGPDDPIVFGDASKSPMLEPLSDE